MSGIQAPPGELVDVDRLARMIGVSQSALRDFLRWRYPTKAPGKGGRWVITLTMIVSAARHFQG